jgi:DNA polymerase III subunit delta'
LNHFDIARGQAKAWLILSRSHATGRGASTYLFHGASGVGHWSLALELTALLNCRNPLDDITAPGVRYACGECQPCRSVRSLNFEGFFPVVPIPPHKNSSEAVDLTNEVLDLKRQEPFADLDASRPLSIPIDRAREVKRALSVRGGEGITRVVLFYQMEHMRDSSADALLKLIEEPPPQTVVILTAPRPDALLPTIQSRSQRIRLERLPEQMMVAYLCSAHGLDEQQARLACRISDGSLGQALEMIRGEASADSSSRAVALLLFKSLVSDDSPAVITRLTEMVNFSDRSESESLIRTWQSFIRDCFWYAQTGEAEGIINIDFTSDIERLSRSFSEPAAVTRMVGAVRNTLAVLPLNVHIQAAVVALTLRLKAALSGEPVDATGEM